MDAAKHTFMFADLAGFTALTEAHGDEQAADLAGEFSRRLRAIAPGFTGQVVKTIGDAVMIRCQSAGPAVDLALTIIEKVGSHANFPTVRVGLHTGTAVERAGDWFGSSVNVAARVSALAAGSDVLLSSATAEAATLPASIELERLGERDLRNVFEPLVLFRARRSGKQVDDADVDPVCRMTVAEHSEAGSLAYEGVTYRFCSLACAKRFANAPGRYVGQSTG